MLVIQVEQVEQSANSSASGVSLVQSVQPLQEAHLVSRTGDVPPFGACFHIKTIWISVSSVEIVAFDGTIWPCCLLRWASTQADPLSKSRSWALAALFLHAGGSAYAGIYCWGLVVVSAGDGLLAALMMTPPMIIPLVIAIVWQKRIIQHAG